LRHSVYCLPHVYIYGAYELCGVLFVSATIRRLYDIANILISLQLVQKLSAVEPKSRKALFMYIGPHSEDMAGTYLVARDAFKILITNISGSVLHCSAVDW